jgi:hypothetical protein
MGTVFETVFGKLLALGSVVGLVGVLGSVLACGGDATSPGLTPTQVYWALQLNQHAVTLAQTAPYDTIQLTAVPLNAVGQPLAGLGPVHYSTNDSLVTVDSTGLVTAKFVTLAQQTAKVVASLTDPTQHVTLVDTCFIQVTATVPNAPLATFVIQPTAGSDTVMPVNQGAYGMRVTATDSIGDPLPAFPYFTSSDPSIARIDRLTGSISGVRTGQVVLYATTWAYGVAKRDSIPLRVGVRSQATIQVLAVAPTGSTHPILMFWPQIVTVTAGAVVIWKNSSMTDSIDVVFDDPTNVDSVRFTAFYNFGSGEGNIAPWVQDTTGSNPVSAMICAKAFGVPPDCNNFAVINFGPQRRRIFPVPGSYHYHSTKWGTSGTIVVQ